MASPPAVAPEKRLRWQSRRGLLELDLLLEGFWRRHGDALSPPERSLLAKWLAQDDVALWRLLRHPPPQGRALAAKIANSFKR